MDYDATCCPVLWTIYLLFETLELPVMFSLTLRRLQCVHRICTESQPASTGYHDSNLVVSLRSHSNCLSQQLFSARR